MRRTMICLLLLFTLFGAAFGGETIKTLTFSTSDVLLGQYNGYDVVNMRGATSTGKIGEPSLPRLTYTFVIPQSASIEKVEVIACKEVSITGEFIVLPAQPFCPLSHNQPTFVEPDDSVYSSIGPYPSRIVFLGASGSKAGYRLCGVSVYPLQYYPAERKLILYESITLRLTYEEGVRKVEPRTPEQLRHALHGLQVANPEDIPRFSPPLQSLSDGEIQYLIVTKDSLAPYFEPLANWKTKKGVPTAIRTVSWIDVHYSGYDMAEKFRNYEKELFADSGLVWVLIGVDADSASWWDLVSDDIVRKCDVVNIHSPCLSDLYFGDLDGDWNANGNEIYGEPTDSVDMYSDVYVGRASVDDTLQVMTFVEKTLTYEKTPAGSYEASILLVASQLVGTYWGDVVCDSIANHIPIGWDITKFYESQGANLLALPDSLNKGFGYFEFALHGDMEDVHYMDGTVIMDTTDADNLTNTPRYSIGTAISCFIGWFCTAAECLGDCLCEHFMNNPAGGTVGLMGNAGFGWGHPPELGPSELLNLDFYKAFLDSNVYHIGAANAVARDKFVHLTSSDTANQEALVWRASIYVWNLFGDPELPMRQKGTADTLSVSYSDSIPTGPQDFIVTVDVSGAPLANALVCVWKGDEVYVYGYTNPSGSAILTINPLTEGIMEVTVTAQDCLPFEGTAYVSPTAVTERTDVQSLRFELSQNSPNPMSRFTQIEYILPETGLVDVSIYDVTGRSIKTLFHGVQKAGYHKVIWDRRKNDGNRVSNGIYFYKLQAGDYAKVRKMVIIKEEAR